MQTLRKIIPAAAFGALVTLLTYVILSGWGNSAGDFTWPWRAARLLLGGDNPYRAILPGGEYPYNDYFYYPLPTAVFAIPFSVLPPYAAGALFFGASSGLLFYAIRRERPYLWPVFLSAPFYVAATVAQWSPLLMAAALLPNAFRWLWILKPTTGFVAFAYRPTRKGALLVIALLALSLLVLLSWPMDYLHIYSLAQRERYAAPLMQAGGAVLFLALLGLRRPEGRALLAASIMPRNPYWYDGLMLWLVPHNLRQSLMLSILSWFAFLGWSFGSDGDPLALSAWPWQIVFLYAPCAAMVAMPVALSLYRKVTSPSPLQNYPQMETE